VGALVLPLLALEEVRLGFDERHEPILGLLEVVADALDGSDKPFTIVNLLGLFVAL
jgi:hypothetical protein